MNKVNDPGPSIAFRKKSASRFAADLSAISPETDLHHLQEFLTTLKPGTSIFLLLPWNALLDRFLRFVTGSTCLRIVLKEPSEGNVALTLERI